MMIFETIGILTIFNKPASQSLSTGRAVDFFWGGGGYIMKIPTDLDIDSTVGVFGSVV